MKQLIFLFLLIVGGNLNGQIDSTKEDKLTFTGDVRLRVEHDWKSQNSNGILRNARSRMRYRFRFGLNYSLDKYSSFGGRIRSGNINDQQGPHVTIGGNQGEFGLVKIGFEKLYYQFEKDNFVGWVGKNTIPLKKLNELFWNDNVFPEGVGLKYKRTFESPKLLNSLSINTGHFIIRSNNKTFNQDSYLQIFQIESNLLNNRVSLFPAYYYFHQIGNFPDGKQTFELDYAISHFGSQITVSKKHNMKLGMEVYKNLQDYSDLDHIPANLKKQTNGLVLSVAYGKVEERGDWLIYFAYANIQKYAIVDYFAQNDWSRWDYSSIGATGSRISNFHGVEMRIGYAFKKNYTLILRSYFVEQLVQTGNFKENGNRIRLDLNIGF